MTERMTPSRVLEEYDIVGRRIPNGLIDEIRVRFQALEEKGEDSWKILCNEISSAQNIADKDNKIQEDRKWIVHACAEVLTEKITYKLTNDRLSWKDRVIALQTREDYLNFFACLNISEEMWKNSNTLSRKHAGLCSAIRERFEGRWNSFLDFMRIPEEDRRDYLKKQVGACATREDFLELFARLKIPEEVWRSPSRLSKGHSGLRNAIRERFEGRWNSFLDFMRIPEEDRRDYLKKQVGACATREDFLELFARLKIPEEVWKKTSMLQQKNSSLCAIVWRRFDGNWYSFLHFMEVPEEERKNYWKKQVGACATREDFLELFARLKIPEEVWRSSHELAKTRSGVHYSIWKRFNEKWDTFLHFMEVPREVRYGYWRKQVDACVTREDLLKFSAHHKIPEEVLMSASKLVDRSAGLSSAIKKRFKNRGIFRACMDGRLPFNGIANPAQARDLLREEILRLRSTDKWIQKPMKGNRVTKAEWEEITKPKWYRKNPVVKAVADYLRENVEN